MHDGSALILGAAKIAEEYQKSLGDHPTPEAFRKNLGPKNEDSLLRVAIAGWGEARDAETLKDHLNQMEEISETLKGGFSILGDCATLLDKIVSDSYSPMIFHRILTLDPAALLKDSDAADSVDNLRKALAKTLQGNSAAYYLARYDEATGQIAKLINLLVERFVSLPDGDLLKVGEIDATSGDPSTTITGHMKSVLTKIGPKFPEGQRKAILELIESIERSLSKERAAKALEELSPGKRSRDRG